MTGRRRGRSPERLVDDLVRRANLDRQPPLCYCDSLDLPWLHHHTDHHERHHAARELRAERSNP